MGVIDLDARVRKLEQEGAGGAVIDQIEAELTALDEQINGDGELDLGLAGDVAALELDVGGLVEDVTADVFTPDPEKTFTTNTLKFYKIKNLIYIIGVAETSGETHSLTSLTLGTIATAYRPAATQYVWTWGAGSKPVCSAITAAGALIQYSGTSDSGTSWCYINGCYPITTT